MMDRMSLPACHTPPCPPGMAIADPHAHAAWHAELREQATAGDSIATVGDLICAWLDELDVAAVEQLVLASEPTMTDSPVAGTIEVLRKLAREQ